MFDIANFVSMDKWQLGKLFFVKALLTSKNDPNLDPKRIRSADHINSIVIHTTGWGKGHDRAYKLYKDDINKFGEYYCEFQERLAYNPHMTVAPNGDVFQFAPLQFRTHHTGNVNTDRYNYYRSPKWVQACKKKYKWWVERYPNLNDPTEFPAWKPFAAGGKRAIRSVNSQSISVDLLPFLYDGKIGFNEAQIEKLAYVVACLAYMYNIPVDRLHIVSHSDVNPVDRVNRRGPTDLNLEFDWDGFMEQVENNHSKIGMEPEEDIVDVLEDIESLCSDIRGESLNLLPTEAFQLGIDTIRSHTGDTGHPARVKLILAMREALREIQDECITT